MDGPGPGHHGKEEVSRSHMQGALTVRTFEFPVSPRQQRDTDGPHDDQKLNREITEPGEQRWALPAAALHIGEKQLSPGDAPLVLVYFHARRKEWGIRVVAEQRVQVSPTRFRVPDVCVVLGEPAEQIFKTPPFICIEILSKDDRLSDMQDRVADYLNFGVRYVWVIDPRTRKAWRCTLGAISEVNQLRTEDPEIVVPLDALFDGD